jgi:hypothetical protein
MTSRYNPGEHKRPHLSVNNKNTEVMD